MARLTESVVEEAALTWLEAALTWLESLGYAIRHGPQIAPGERAAESLRQLVRDFADPVEVVEEALAAVPGIEAAFVFGSFARGDYRDDSDVDVLVVGEQLAEARLGRAMAEASVLLGRPVEIRAYTRERLERQLEAGNVVLRRILEGPKRWIIGDEQRLGVAA